VNARATVQSIAEVLNHTYIPSAGDKPLFDLKNSYWYKVLVDIIQESSLQAIVNAGPVGDGQTVWTNIVTEAKKSMMARISIAHCLPHHFQDLRWHLAGYRHCIS
jgi:hypothetical protein